MYVLGLSFDYHDSAAAILRDGEIVAAAQEERFSRRKNDHTFPGKAVAFCHDQAGISARDVNIVVYYESAILKFERIVCTSLRHFWRSRRFLQNALQVWLEEGKFWPEERVATALGIPTNRIVALRHHESHQGAAYFNSPFDKAVVITMDGIGEYETGSISVGEGHALTQYQSIRLPNSLGLFYSAITAYLGFKVNEDEYKVMGMAGFGTPRFYDILRPLFSLTTDGLFVLRQKFFNFDSSMDVPYTARMVEAFGPPRVPETSFSTTPTAQIDEQASVLCQHYADIAASAQKVTEEVMLHLVGHAMRRFGVMNVCMSGGVALNSLANGRLKRELGCNLYVHPAAGDAGGSLGAAQYYWHGRLGNPKRSPSPIPYLGKAYDLESIEVALKAAHLRRYQRFADTTALLKAVAERIHRGQVVGWLHGRFEWGPRALGCRSILANPTRPDMQKIVNTKVKFREPFRPFAPAVLEERAGEFFELPPVVTDRDPEYYMLAVCTVRPEKRHAIPAVTHVDGSARVQLVRRDWNPRYYDLIREFERLSGVPVLLNTSFNLRGEPIVNSPADAIKTFGWSGIDCLVLEDYLIGKD